LILLLGYFNTAITTVKREAMMAKIAMIGAGSLVFCKTLMSDFLATPA